MTVGGAHGEPSTADKQALTSAFADTGYHLTWAADMDAWYKCHLAFILPIVYLSYALDCDLRRATGKQIKTGLQAVREGYGLLDALGYPILPEDTMEKLHGFKRIPNGTEDGKRVLKMKNGLLNCQKGD